MGVCLEISLFYRQKNELKLPKSRFKVILLHFIPINSFCISLINLIFNGWLCLEMLAALSIYFCLVNYSGKSELALLVLCCHSLFLLIFIFIFVIRQWTCYKKSWVSLQFSRCFLRERHCSCFLMCVRVFFFTDYDLKVFDRSFPWSSVFFLQHRLKFAENV